MELLTQFAFRLAFGLSLAMAVTPSRLVASGYYRVHLYVVLGLNVLAALVAWNDVDARFALWPPISAAVVSYVGSVCWLYERRPAGVAALVISAGLSLVGAWLAQDISPEAPAAAQALRWLDPVSGGLLLGAVMAAMLLGHWYLNSPGMQLAPLRRLILLIGCAVAARAVLSGVGAALEFTRHAPPETNEMLFLTLRWSAGFVGTAVVAGMSWQTLKIPNTQSATGILYVGVITSFLGELTAQLLSARTMFPL